LQIRPNSALANHIPRFLAKAECLLMLAPQPKG
jgi:hypothetical protein